MSAEPTGELQTILHGTAFAPLTDRAFLRITGPDAPRWLNGMVTNNVQALGPGEGNYNFFLNAQGRIGGDCTIYRSLDTGGASFLLETTTDQIETLHQLLDKFIIMDDVELERLNYPGSLLLLGPTIGGVLSVVRDSVADEGLEPLHLYDFFSAPATTPAAGLIPKILLPSGSSQDLRAFTEAVQTTGAIQVSPAALEALRILEARPRYGTDIRNTDTAKDLPQETNQAHALHFAKGCYLGQEIVERIRSRGQVHRLFTPFRLAGTLPETFPAPLTAGGKPAGELTSATTLPTTEGPVLLALGYARREFVSPVTAAHAPLTYLGGIAHPRAAGQLA